GLKNHSGKLSLNPSQKDEYVADLGNNITAKLHRTSEDDFTLQVAAKDGTGETYCTFNQGSRVAMDKEAEPGILFPDKFNQGSKTTNLGKTEHPLQFYCADPKIPRLYEYYDYSLKAENGGITIEKGNQHATLQPTNVNHSGQLDGKTVWLKQGGDRLVLR